MRIAGVRLLDGRLIWVDAARHELDPLEEVTVRIDSGEEPATVYVTPEQLFHDSGSMEGVITARHTRAVADSDACEDLPGAHFPPLGSMIETPDGPAVVISIDHASGKVRTSSGHDVSAEGSPRA